MPSISESLALAIQRHRSGQLEAAEQIYRQILAADPRQVDALHLLGMLAQQVGKHELAIEYIGRAIAQNGQAAELHASLAKAYHDARRIPEAVASYRRAVALKPEFFEAHNNLGVSLRDDGNLVGAVACFRRALGIEPSYSAAWTNLSHALREQGRLAEAVACGRRVVELEPNRAEAHRDLGVALRDLGELAEAVAAFHRALALKPDFAGACNNLGVTLHLQGHWDEAVGCYRRALELEPALVTAQSNLGNALRDLGRLEEAVASFGRALELRPDFHVAHSNLIYTKLFQPGFDARTLGEAHRRWAEIHAAPWPVFGRYGNDRDPNRRLRVGYVSPDFRDHVVGRNLWPLLREHDHERVEVFCYADSPIADALTARLRSCADVWCETTGFGDDQLAGRIREDRIDILVDLTLHMACNRLFLFARKPAPVQATFAGYPGTTGLSAVDYRLTDPYLDPAGLDDAYYSEQSIRLPDSFWCYDPLDSNAAANALPVAEKGAITFGCLNNFCKINPSVLELWASVLRAVDRSRLMLLAGEGSHRETTLTFLAEQGVARERVIFVPPQPRDRYLEYYHDIDIGLDTVPYNGHTTSLDSLWMGVPVVTLVGSTVVGRAGLCQLMNLGLPELIACTPEQYVRIASALAGDLTRLSWLRSTLRERMQASPLMDAPRFARGVEGAYRQMWRRWCA